MNPLLELKNAGQSIWLDFITRKFMNDGKLKALIDKDGISGVTSNPTIFQKAITGGTEYDNSINDLLKKDTAAEPIFDALAIADIQQACDLFKPTFDQAKGGDGFVSIEVKPSLAHDTPGTLAEARRLWTRVNRRNVMIKIPATEAGVPAIEQAIGEGININITLIFSLERYQQVMDAWLAGLERLAQSGKPVTALASVACFFVSRVDVLVDSLLDKKIAAAGSAPMAHLHALKGKAAIANATLAYQMFRKQTAAPRFKALAAKGARVQRPLWASTSTKNPQYRDVIYVEELIGPDTVNTLPPATIDAFRDHGKVRESLLENPAASVQAAAELAKAGIDMAQVTQQLEDDGVKLFADSYNSMIKSIEEKRKALKVAR
jgi:transaldolase